MPPGVPSLTPPDRQGTGKGVARNDTEDQGSVRYREETRWGVGSEKHLEKNNYPSLFVDSRRVPTTLRHLYEIQSSHEVRSGDEGMTRGAELASSFSRNGFHLLEWSPFPPSKDKGPGSRKVPKHGSLSLHRSPTSVIAEGDSRVGSRLLYSRPNHPSNDVGGVGAPGRHTLDIVRAFSPSSGRTYPQQSLPT